MKKPGFRRVVRELGIGGVDGLPGAALSVRIAYAHHVAGQPYRTIAREFALTFHTVRTELTKFKGRC